MLALISRFWSLCVSQSMSSTLSLPRQIQIKKQAVPHQVEPVWKRGCTYAVARNLHIITQPPTATQPIVTLVHCTWPGRAVDSIRLAMLTVSPNSTNLTHVHCHIYIYIHIHTDTDTLSDYNTRHCSQCHPSARSCSAMPLEQHGQASIVDYLSA